MAKVCKYWFILKVQGAELHSATHRYTRVALSGVFHVTCSIMKRMSLNLPDELVQPLEAAAQAARRSRSNYVLTLLEEWLIDQDIARARDRARAPLEGAAAR